MTIYFSKSTLTFFDTDLSSGVAPEDGIEVTFEKRNEMINPKEGFILSADKNGYPILVEYVQTEEEKKEIVLNTIQSLERKSMMPRALRDLLLSNASTNDTAKQEIQSIEDQIATLRKGL